MNLISSPNNPNPFPKILDISGEFTKADMAVMELTPFSKEPLKLVMLPKQYPFKGQKGQRIMLLMVSDEIDSRLVLHSPDGESLQENDDISPSDRNAKIIQTLPQDGTYSVQVQSSQQEPGRFHLMGKIID